MSKQQALFVRPAWERIAARVEALGLAIDPIISEEDGSYTFQGQKRDIADLEPEIAWLSNDVFGWKPLRELAIALLKAPSLKWVQTASAGLDNPLFRGIYDKGAKLTNSDAQALAIAEFVLARVLSSFHPTERRREAQAAHEWARLGFKEIWHTNWLIIGFGNIGQEIAKRAKGFDAHVTGVRRSGGTHPHADVLIAPKDILGQLPGADVVVLACPLTEETRLIANKEFFAAMKEGATLVNIGRGGLLDEDALIAALDEDKPSHAILDVFETEPLPATSPLWDHSKIAASAHTSAFGSGTRARGDDLFLENLSHYLKGEPLRNEVSERHFE